MAWRVLLTGKWLVLTLIALLAIAACGLAAVWQWDRSQQQLRAEQAGLAAPTNIAAVVQPGQPDVPIEALGRQVLVDGEYIPRAQSLIRSRLSDSGEEGYWVVDGVRTGDGAVVAVLRGWSSTADVEAPTGSVSLGGRLQPDENFYPNAAISADEPLVTITESGLMKQWTGVSAESGDQGAAVQADEFVPGFVAATDVTPQSPGLTLVQPVIGQDPDVGFPWRNVLYSLQWVVFAAFVVIIWVKWFRDDVREQAARDAASPRASEAQDRVSLGS